MRYSKHLHATHTNIHSFQVGGGRTGSQTDNVPHPPAADTQGRQTDTQISTVTSVIMQKTGD